MKIAIAGKGGAGKSFIAANLSKIYAGHETGQPERVFTERTHATGQVYALDADPCGGLGAALGLSQNEIDSVKPIADMREFIEPGKDDGALYMSDADISSVDGRFSALADGVNFLRMAQIKQAGEDCYCREHGFLQALINSMLLGVNDVLILDMSAGIEPLIRGTVKGADILLIVSEATRACIETSKVIRSLGRDLGIRHSYIVANKIRSEKEELLIRASFHRGELAGLIRMSEAVAEQAIGIGSDRGPLPFKVLAEIEEIFHNLQTLKIKFNNQK